MALAEQTQDHKFQRLFIVYGASGNGFAFYRSTILGLDSTHLKTKYLSILLIATTVDANNQLFPLAFGVVDDQNCLWFCYMMSFLNVHQIS